MRIRPLKLMDERYGDQWSREIEDRWVYEDMLADEAWRRGWISFDCACYEPDEDRVYLGITSFANDIFRAYDRARDKFIDLDYASVAHPFDAKFHRSMEKGPDGSLYCAIALLHCVDRFNDAPGGAIVRYEPRTGAITKLCIPLPHVYIQSIALDPRRRLIHAACFAPEKLVTFNLATGQVTDHGLIGTGIGGMCQGENLCLDDHGNCWSNWQLTRAWQNHPGVDCQRLCRIVPDENRIHFHQAGLPHPHKPGATVKAEAFFNLGDGYMYASGANGSLFRIDPDTAQSEYLFTPIADRPSRLTSLVLASDGLAYGVTGRGGDCRLLRFDFRNSRYELVGDPIRSQDNDALWQCHHLVVTPDNTLYVCENDVPDRSGYLWELTDAINN